MNSKLPILTFIYDRYHKASLNRKASIELRITYEGKQKYISTGIRIYSNQWKNNIVVNSPDSIILNQTLDTLLIEVRHIIYSMAEINTIDIYAIPNKLNNIHNANISFIDFCIKRANIRKYGKAKDTQERYERFIRLFKEYGNIINFEDITETNIINYDSYLSKQNLKPYSKWNNYHRFLNSFIIDAINEGLLTKNPYKWITIDRDKKTNGLSNCLTPSEFNKIKNTPMPTKSLERIKDLFIFQTYTCLSYSDLKRFDPTKLIEINGIKTYIGKREKTNIEFTIPILKPASDILEKYGGVLPILSNVKYNEYLKIIAQASGIDRPISTHWARHTGATLLLNEGIDMKIVSKICGHSSMRITEKIYAKLLDDTVVKAISKLKDTI